MGSFEFFVDILRRKISSLLDAIQKKIVHNDVFYFVLFTIQNMNNAILSNENNRLILSWLRFEDKVMSKYTYRLHQVLEQTNNETLFDQKPSISLISIWPQ